MGVDAAAIRLAAVDVVEEQKLHVLQGVSVEQKTADFCHRGRVDGDGVWILRGSGVEKRKYVGCVALVETGYGVGEFLRKHARHRVMNASHVALSLATTSNAVLGRRIYGHCCSQTEGAAPPRPQRTP